MIKESEKRSFESVNYMFRPKKQIERKIIIEILQNLSPEIKLNDYIYIGLGSIYYYDFILIHKFLNLKKMISIDDKSTVRRFIFNRPYDYIKFINKKSTEFLQAFNWKASVILWLDYDSKFDVIVLDDLSLISQNCSSGDVVIITLEARIHTKEDWPEFKRKFGTYVSPKYNKQKYFTPKNFPILIQNVVINYLNADLEYRDINFHKIFSFKYKDTAQMYTLGGVFGKENIFKCKKWKNGFVEFGEKIIDIDVPNLTYREKFYIDSHIKKLKQEIEEIEKNTRQYSDYRKREQVMTKKLNKCTKFEISYNDIKKYISYYRYYPQYYEGLI